MSLWFSRMRMQRTRGGSLKSVVVVLLPRVPVFGTRGIFLSDGWGPSRGRRFGKIILPFTSLYAGQVTREDHIPIDLGIVLLQIRRREKGNFLGSLFFRFLGAV